MKSKLVLKTVASALAATMILTSCAAPKPAATPAPAAPATPASAAPAAPAASKAPEAAKPAEKTIRAIWWGSQTRHDLTQKVMKMYEGLNPGVKFMPEFTSWDQYWEKNATMAAANNLPDIMQQDYAYIKQYADKGLVVPLDAYVGKELNVADISKTILDSGTIGGKLFAISLGSNSQSITYDPAMFKEAGVAEPTATWTWEDYAATARALKSKLKISFADSEFPGCTYEPVVGFQGWLTQNGASLYSADGKDLGYTDDNLFAQFFDMQTALVKDKAIAPHAVRVEIKNPESELIVTKQAAMYSAQWSNQFSAVSKAAGRPLALAHIPNMKDQKQSYQFIKPSQFWSVTKDSKNPAEAAKFVSYFTNDVEANKVLNAERGVPISSKIREALMPTLDPVQKQIFDYVGESEKIASPIPAPNPTGHNQVVALLSSLQSQITSGEVAAKDVAAKFRTEAVKILSTNK